MLLGALIAFAVVAGGLDADRSPARGIAALALVAVATVGLLALVRAAARDPLRPAVVLALAAALRLVLLPMPPVLSTDVWRYLWDGRVAAGRENPYLHAPDDPALARLRSAGDGAELWRRVEHREVPGVYPPLPLTVWSFVARLPLRAAVPVWKGLAAVADLLACWLLLRLARRDGWPQHRVLWYAAHPLVAIEVAGMGHVEPLGVAACVATVLLLARRPPRTAAAGVAAAAAVLAKLAPLALWPLWLRQSGARRAGEERTGHRLAGLQDQCRFLLAAVVVAGLGLAPMLASVEGPPPGLVTYGGRWEFAGPLHEPLWRLLQAVDAPARVEHSLDVMKEWTGMHERLNRLYPWNYPQLQARLLLLPLVLAAIFAGLRGRGRFRDPVAGTAATFGVLLLCSPTLYPWYLLWVLPFAALLADRAWLWVAAVAPLCYLPGLLGPAADGTPLLPWWPWLHVVVWGPFAVLALHARWRRGAGSSPAEAPVEAACAGG